MSVIQNNWATTDWCRYGWCVPTGYDLIPTQVQLVSPSSKRIGCQIRLVSYNITQLRILWEIKSDGIEAANYTSSSDASTDKAVVNLKSDIVEKYWQSSSASSEWFRWDTGSGRVISLDTFALIQHNLTSSAVVTIKGSGASGDSEPVDWSAVSVYATLTLSDDPDEDNLIYISPTQPSSSYRWWRIDINDPTNPDGFIRIGRVVGGSALIFAGNENCLDDISFMEENYKDEMPLNGFSRVANNRSLKKKMELSFRDLDTVAQTNFRLLKRYMRYCRDTLKALVIVDPQTETSKYEFTAFAKLKVMPERRHKYIDSASSYTALQLQFDEGR